MYVFSAFPSAIARTQLSYRLFLLLVVCVSSQVPVDRVLFLTFTHLAQFIFPPAMLDHVCSPHTIAFLISSTLTFSTHKRNNNTVLPKLNTVPEMLTCVLGGGREGVFGFSKYGKHWIKDLLVSLLQVFFQSF